MNKDNPRGKIFPPLPRNGDSPKEFPLKYCSNKCQKLLKSFKKGDVKLKIYNITIPKKDDLILYQLFI